MPKSDKLSPGAVKLLQDPQLAQLATVMADGSPQLTPVWVDVEDDGSHVLVNTADGRLKTNNVERDPRVAVSVVDNKNPWHFAIVRGTIVERRHDGAVDHINKLSRKYMGHEYQNFQPGEQRVILRIKPSHVLESMT